MGRLDRRPANDQGARRQDNFSGLNNVAPAERLDPSELREAINIDVSREGRITRRSGFEEVYSGTAIRSMIAFGPHTLFAEGTALKALDGGVATTWLTGLHGSNRLAHVIRDNLLRFTDGVDNYVVNLDGDVESMTTQAQALIAAGPAIRTQNWSPMPAGNLMTYALGRLWIARGKFLWYSEPLTYAVTNLAFNFFPYNEDITILAGTEEAVIVAADGHYVLKGANNEEIRQTKLFEYGAPKGNVVYSEVAHLGLEGLGIGAAWLSDEGIMVANAQGAVVNQTEGRVAFPEYDEAATMLREEDGARRLIAAARSKGQAGSFAVEDNWDVEIRRNGVTV